MTVVALAEIADQIRGVSYGKTDVVDRPAEGFLPVLRANNITDNGLSFDDLVYVRGEKVSPKQKVRSGDIVIAASSGSISVVGKAAQAEDDLDMGFGAFCKVVRPSPKVHARYIGHFFKTQNYRRRMSALAAGANINNLKNEHIDEIEIPLPSLEEQKRIAAILDQADELRRKRQRAIDRLNQLGQAIFHEMFGDVRTNPMGWEIVKLGDVCGVGSSKRVFVEEFVDEGIPFYRGTEVGKLATGEVIEPDLFIAPSHYAELIAHSGKPEIGDLLLPSICHDGRIWRVDDETPFYFKDGRVLWIKQNEAIFDSEYLRNHLRNAFLSNYHAIASGTTFAELKIVNLKGLSVLCPPLKDQAEFSERIQEVESSRRNMVKSENEAASLFASLQHRAFQGEL